MAKMYQPQLIQTQRLGESKNIENGLSLDFPAPVLRLFPTQKNTQKTSILKKIANFIR